MSFGTFSATREDLMGTIATMPRLRATRPLPSPAVWLAAIEARLVAVVDGLFEWQERAQQRRLLAALDPAALKDCGLTPGDRAAESAKPFWRG